jgi:thymidylate synthase (FAD)
MKLCKPSYEIWKQSSGLEGIYKQIEKAGRVCYKSEDKITEDSAKPFVDRMIKSGHHSVLEHGTVYLLIPQINNIESCNPFYTPFTRNKYSKEKIIKDSNENRYAAVSTNMRVIIENNLEDYLQYICEPTEYHEKRVTVKFVCDRVTGESFLRHRAIDEDHPTIEGEVTREMEKDIDSFARESTRYCNYTKDKFNGEFTIITPPEFYDNDIESDIHDWGTCDDAAFRRMCYFISEEQDSNFNIFDTWLFANLATQWSYNRLIELGWRPQQARRIIPLDIKSPLVMTAFVEDWKHFFDLRCAPSAHPQARELAIPLEEEFKSLNLI